MAALRGDGVVGAGEQVVGIMIGGIWESCRCRGSV